MSKVRIWATLPSRTAREEEERTSKCGYQLGYGVFISGLKLFFHKIDEIPLQTTLQLSHNFCVRVFLHEFQLFFQQCFLGTKLYNWWGKTNQNIHTIKSNNAIIIQSYNQKNKYAKKDVHTIRWKKKKNRKLIQCPTYGWYES